MEDAVKNHSQKQNSTKRIETMKKQNELLDFVRQLHASLNLNQVLVTFEKKLKTLIHHQGFQYQSPQHSIVFSKGQLNEAYRIDYQLDLNEKSLGTVNLSRARDFTEQERQSIEEYLCFLLHPLDNALTHKSAIDKAARDPLTQLLNRTTLAETLEREINLAKRHSQKLSLLLIDIDDFKTINDQLGHLIGDKVLTGLASSLMQCIRKTDLAYRIGGEEFLLILNKTNVNGALKLADRLRKTIENTPLLALPELSKVTVSVGISTYIDGDNKHNLFQRADEALYRAKKQGKNRVST